MSPGADVSACGEVSTGDLVPEGTATGRNAMDSYPCPVCGGRATEATGCQRCGRPHDPDAAAFAMFRRAAAALETKKKNLTADQKLLMAQIAHVTAQRDSLRRKILNNLLQEAPEDTRRGAGLGRKILRRTRDSAAQYHRTPNGIEDIPSPPAIIADPIEPP
ncbi:MAG: hypothetical protein JXA67_12070, partial [Micromonosporaceae bacterium]|nr:hypothetical protein [Micromonosporaceae bacterium]